MYRYQRIIFMRDKGRSVAQIAERMGIKENSVRIILKRYGRPDLHEAYKASLRTAEARAKAGARRKARRERLGIQPWVWPAEFRNDIVRRREDGQSYRSISRELDISVGVISGIMYRHRKASTPELENA